MSASDYKRWHKPNISESSKTRQGYYKITNTDKYIGDPSLIIYRSSWEMALCRWCDYSPSVIRWSAEPLSVPYYDRVSNLNEIVKLGLDPNNPVNWKRRNYHVDFYMEIMQGDNMEKWFVEVKPAYKLKKPEPVPNNAPRKQQKAFNEAAKEYLINEAKFEACKAYAKNHNGEFYVFTENVLRSLGIIGKF